MPGREDRDALRTERYVNDLLAAAGRGGQLLDEDGIEPDVRLAARRLMTDLTPLHPAFRFEEALAGRLAAAANSAGSGTLTAFPAPVSASAASAERDTAGTTAPRRAILPAAAIRRIPEVASRPSRPFLFGGVGVASAAISIGAVYVAWRHARPASGRMGRAVRAAHDRSAGSGRSRRSGLAHGIFGVLS